jgi:hypothetical protein
MIAKLLWKFDIELDGPQEDWVKGARFYVSDFPIFLRIERRWTDKCTDPVGARTSDGEVEGRTMSGTCRSISEASRRFEHMEWMHMPRHATRYVHG